MSNQRLQLSWYNKDKALIPSESGKYRYRWVEQTDPRYCETHTLIYDEYVQGEQSGKLEGYEYSERSDLNPTHDNLLILGESGDVLKTLTRVPELAEKYVGKVKLIYIDPPFNTEQTFESYEDNLEHSIWLTMMRDRLYNLKKLLSDDGSIWVHLDDSEVHRMRLLMDEVFGASNFIAEFVWQKVDSPRSDVKLASVDHDIILSYAKSTATKFNRMERTPTDNARFKNPDSDSDGVWWSADRSAPNSTSSNGKQVPAVFAITHPLTNKKIYPPIGRQWAFRKERVWEALNEYTEYVEAEPDLNERSLKTSLSLDKLDSEVKDLVPRYPFKAKEETEERINEGNWPEIFITETTIGRKAYPPAQGQPARTWWTNDEVGHNRSAKSEIKALFPGVNPFSTPKPERLLERILHIASNPGDIVLDCFGGSGTTAAVAQKMGRNWILNELLDSTFNNFILPRLKKIIHNEDPGGITRTKKVRMVADNVNLPEGVSPEDAAKFTNVLNKLITGIPDLKQSSEVKKIKSLAKTKYKKEQINWRGGGGFQVAHLSPSCFDYDEELDRVILTNEATGRMLIDSVCANLGYNLLEKNHNTLFDGRKGRSYLKVYEGIADTDLVDSLVATLGEKDSLVLATTGLVDGVREYLRGVRKGSRIIHLPDGIFKYSEEGRNE